MCIYIYRERERDVCVYIYICICIYIYIYNIGLQAPGPACLAPVLRLLRPGCLAISNLEIVCLEM